MAEDSTLFNTFGLTVEAGKVVFKEGDIGDTMYIIQSGNILISKAIKGKDHQLAVLGKGDFFGEMAIVTNEKRSATAVAKTDSKLLSFDRQGFISMLNKNAKIALNIIEKLCRRVANLHQQIQHLVKGNNRGIMAIHLLYSFEDAKKSGKLLNFDEMLQDVSLNLELPLDNIMDFIEQFEKEGIIKRENGSLKLINKKKLEDVTEKVIQKEP